MIVAHNFNNLSYDTLLKLDWMLSKTIHEGVIGAIVEDKIRMAREFL